MQTAAVSCDHNRASVVHVHQLQLSAVLRKMLPNLAPMLAACRGLDVQLQSALQRVATMWSLLQEILTGYQRHKQE